MVSSLASSQYICIIPNTPYESRHTYNRSFYTSNQNQIQTYILIRSGSHWFTHQEAFVILINTLTFIEDKANVRTREKFQLRPARFPSTLLPKSA